MDNDSDQNNRDRSRRGDRRSGAGSRFSNDRDRSRDRERSDCRRIYVSNVPYEYRWQDLKDLFRKEVGDVSFVELFHDENNKPRGCGIVEFEKPEHVQMALEKMNRYDINGRNLVIKEDYGNERDKYGRVVPKSFRGNDNDNRRRDRDDDRMLVSLSVCDPFLLSIYFVYSFFLSLCMCMSLYLPFLSRQNLRLGVRLCLSFGCDVTFFFSPSFTSLTVRCCALQQHFHNIYRHFHI